MQRGIESYTFAAQYMELVGRLVGTRSPASGYVGADPGNQELNIPEATPPPKVVRQ